MLQTEFDFDDMIVEVECDDVDEYNVYNVKITFMMADDEGRRFEVDPDFDYDTMEEIKSLAHESLLDVKNYSEDLVV